MIRYLKEFPSVHNGLTWTEQYILESIASGITKFSDLFERLPLKEGEYFLGMGNTTFEKVIRNLTEVTTPLIKTTSDKSSNNALVLTPLGKSVLQKTDDWIEKNGINYWRGGAKLSDKKYWRFSNNGNRLIACERKNKAFDPNI